MTKREYLYIGLSGLVSIGFTANLFHTSGLLPTLIIGLGAFAMGIIFWVLTSLKNPTDPRLLLPPYLLTAAMLMLHIAEEYIYDFGTRIGGITSGKWTTEEFLWTLGYGFPIVWIYGAVAIAKRNPFGGFVSCFLFCGMLLGEPTHLLVFPIREMMIHGHGYDYFPGMWTALFPLVTGLWGVFVIITDSRKMRQKASKELANV